MQIFGIFSVLLYFGSLLNFIDCTNWVGDLTRYVVEDMEFKQVMFMTSLSDDKVHKNPLIEKLFVKLMENLPTLRINFGTDFKLPVNSMPEAPDEAVETTKLIGTSATLFLLLIESCDSLPNLITKNFIDAVVKMATYHYTPKYLILSFAPKPSDDVEELLQYAWTKKMLDLTLIELAEGEEGQRYLTGIRGQAALPITQVCLIHQFNPFTKKYSKKYWSSKTKKNIFPNKVINLWGYRLRVFTRKKSPFAMSSPSPFDGVFSILTEKLNCSVEVSYPSVSSNNSDAWRSLYIAIELGNIDIMSLPRTYSLGSWNSTQRTTPIRTDQFCALVPVLPEIEILVSPNFFKAYFLSFSIVLIFWILMRVLRFKSYSWRMFNIARVLFGVSVAQQPSRTAERIIFACLLALFAMFSSTIYASITHIALEKTAEKKFDSFEDLVNSGFAAYIHPLDFQRSSDLFTGPLKGLEDRIVQDTAVKRCPAKLSRSKNLICFIHEQFAKWVQSQDKYERQASMKIARPCFWSESWAFIVGKRSPYRLRLDKLIMRLHSAGIIAKISNVDPTILAKTKSYWEEESNNMHALCSQLIALIIVGYSLSILAFMAEIVIYRVSIYRKSKIRPFILPLFPIRNKIRRE